MVGHTGGPGNRWSHGSGWGLGFIAFLCIAWGQRYLSDAEGHFLGRSVSLTSCGLSFNSTGQVRGIQPEWLGRWPPWLTAAIASMSPGSHGCPGPGVRVLAWHVLCTQHIFGTASLYAAGYRDLEYRRVCCTYGAR
jgi:hypothetical protein